MMVCIVSREEEWIAAIKAAEAKGLRLAMTSNIGLPKGSARLTFLPQSAFTDKPVAAQETK